MNAELIKVMEECTEGSFSGRMTFPAVIKKLSRAGVERYHTDYSRQERTYYLPDGSSHITPMSHTTHPTAQEFSEALIANAVKQSQRNEHTYDDFVRKTMEAGCVGYFVYVAGRCTIYFGRNGESHTERFPLPVASQQR